MPEDSLERRLAAVERAVGEATTDAPQPDDGEPQTDQDGPRSDHEDGLPARVATLEEDVTELEAAVQAVRGYVGGVKHVNDEVEQRADAALAKAEAVEHALDAGRDQAGRDETGRDDTGDPDRDDRPAGKAFPGDAGRQRVTTGDGHHASAERCPHCGATAAGQDGDDGRSRADGGTQPDDRGGRRRTGPVVGEAPGAGLQDSTPTRGADATPGDGDGPAGVDDGPGGVGERTLAPQEDDSGGLLARVREVL